MALLQRLWVLGLLLACASAQGADLITVYREAARTNPQLAAAAASLQAVRERRPQAIAGLLPSIDASGAIERQRLKDLNQSAPADNVTNKLASLDLEYTDIRASIDGVVSEKVGRVGNTVAAGDVVLRISDSSALLAYLRVPQRDLFRFSAGQKAELTLDASATPPSVALRADFENVRGITVTETYTRSGGGNTNSDNPYLDASSNGLTYAAERLKSHEISGHITLRTSERSLLAAIAAESGQVLWSRDLSSYEGVSADWNNLYTVNEEGVVIALTRRNGDETWRQNSLLRREPTVP